MKKGTRLLHTGVEVDPFTGAASVPIYQTSTFHQESIDRPGAYDYSRSGNPTRQALEDAMSVLEEGSDGFAFSSGMAAISSVLSLFKTGDRILVGRDIYGGTFRAVTKLFVRFGIETVFVDTTDLQEVEKQIDANTKAIYLETPANPLMQVSDIEATACLSEKYGLITIVDNTFLTPYFQKPLELGADIVVHSATKYLGGHSDVLAGIAVVKGEELAAELKFVQNAFGAVLSPQDSWLVMRGIKTLKVRLEQHQKSALEIAKWLKRRPEIKEVYYVGLEDHPQYQLSCRQTTGFGGILSFRLQTTEAAKNFLQHLKLPLLGVSLGAVESIITYPCCMSHAAIPNEKRNELGITEDLLRLSVGLEETEDLIQDLKQALDKCGEKI